LNHHGRAIIGNALPTSSIWRNEPNAASHSREALTGSLLRAVLGWQFVWVLFIAVVEVPFLAANKLGAAWIGLAFALFTLLLPAVLLRRGKPIAAAWSFVISEAGITIVLAVLGRGVDGSAPILQLAVAVVAAVLLGRNAALSTSVVCLAVDLGTTIFAARGGHLIVLFPGSTLSNWSVDAIAFALAAPSMYLAVSRLRVALDQSQEQLAALRQAEERIAYQAQLIGQAADPVIAADNNRVVTFWNAAAERLLGRPEKDALGKRLDEAVPFAQGTIPRDRFRAELARTGRWEGELVWLNSAGEARNVDAAITTLRNASGEPIGTVGGFRDITEKRAAEEELRRSEERLHRLTETVPVGITMFDRSGRIVFANSFAASLLETSPSELLKRGMTSPDWEVTDFSGNPFPLEERPFYRVLNTGQPVSNVNYVVQTPSGKRKYLSVSAAPILGPSGEVENVVAALEDITERWELEERYRHAQRMESLGRMAGGVAHDFNNLLTVINGYSQLLLRRLESEGGSQNGLQEPLQQIRKAGQRAADLSRELLAFSRKQVVSSSPLVLNELIQESEPMLRRLLGPDVHMIVRLDPSEGAVLADSGQMQQVLLNLVINARDAMPDGGTVTIATVSGECRGDDPERDPELPPGRYVLLAVEDTGTGMDAETLQHVFEPFFTTKEVGQGTGLGLATVYGIVKQTHGSIRVQSEPGKGARFSIYFPSIDAVSDTSIPPLEQPVRGGTETVLLVDDQPEVRGFLAECLRSYGYSVNEAGSCEEALAVSRQHQGGLDLLITDMMMPGMSGRELAEALEAERPGLRVLLVSGYSAEQVRPLGLPASRFAFVQKPVSPEDLATKVRRLLESSDELSARSTPG